MKLLKLRGRVVLSDEKGSMVEIPFPIPLNGVVRAEIGGRKYWCEVVGGKDSCTLLLVRGTRLRYRSEVLVNILL